MNHVSLEPAPKWSHQCWNTEKALLCLNIILSVNEHSLKNKRALRGNGATICVTTGSDVQIKARTQVSWQLRQWGFTWPAVVKQLHNLAEPYCKKTDSVYPNLTFPFLFLFVFFCPVKSSAVTNRSMFLFILFLHIMWVGVHLSEWNTDGKLGQYSLQLRQKQLSFKSPPHPHFPGVCVCVCVCAAEKPSLQTQQRPHSRLLPPPFAH